MPTYRVNAQYDRPTPAWVEFMLAKFGRNPYGQPIYRVIWSEARLEQVLLADGKYGWQERYPGTERWVLEKWLPTAHSREDWYRLFSDPSGACYLGPYLEHGDYHCCYKLDFRGEFMPLTLAVVEYYCRLIEAGRESTPAERKYALDARRDQAKKQWEDRCDDIIHDSQPAFGVTRLMTGYGAKTSRVKPEDVNLGDMKKLPSWVPRTPGFRQI